MIARPGRNGEHVLPESVQQLILTRIDSVAQLEALLLMRRRPEHAFSPDELASQLYIKPGEAALVMATLKRQELCLESSGLYRYGPGTQALERQVDELADAYREKLILVTNLIHQRARRPEAQSFADVFRFRKDE